MGNGERDERIVRAVRTLQVIVGGMTFGAVFFLVVALFVIPVPAQAGDAKTAYVLLAITTVLLAAWAVVPGIVTTRARKQIADGRWRSNRSLSCAIARFDGDETVALAMVYQTRTTIAAALIEGVVFLNVVGYLATRQLISAIAAAGLIVLLLTHIPRYSRLQNWIGRQRELIEQSGSFAK